MQRLVNKPMGDDDFQNCFHNWIKTENTLNEFGAVRWSDRVQDFSNKMTENWKQFFKEKNKAPTLFVHFGHFLDNANNLVFWCRFLNKLEPWHTVYIMQQ